ncbi:MAG: Ig-like domain-containing protein, partial [Candidatus Sulfomarinibacteraceae bacterium]
MTTGKARAVTAPYSDPARSVAQCAALVLFLICAASTPALAQTATAVDDAFAADSGFLLQVEAPGVLENDHDGGGEPPPPPSAVAILDTDVSHGVLVLNGDGSFDYTSDPGFIGVDTFTYHFVDGAAVSNTATVSLSVDGCAAGAAAGQWICWVEQAYLGKAAELGLSTTVESFEDDVTWAAARSPETAPSVVSQGITWESNFAANEVTTGDGPARSGSWGFYSLPHGDQSGALNDRIYDGFTGTASSPDALLGVGGWVVSQVGSRVELVITYDGGATITPGFPDHMVSFIHEFFGFIDTAGFTSFEVVETDGTVNQPYFVFGDDFSFLGPGADTTPPQVTGVGSWEDTGDGVLSEGETTDAAISELIVGFSEPVQDPPGDTDPDDVTNPANYLLFSDGGDGFQTVNCAGGVAAGDVSVAVEVWEYVSGSPAETVLGVNGGVALPVGTYRLLVCGTTTIVDWAGNALDGDGNGTGGDDFTRNFEITAPVNNPPTADPQSVSTAEDTALGITLTGSDPDGDAIGFAIATSPTHGVLTGTPPNVTYTPAANYNGPDSFTFTTSDGALTSLPATVSITVTPVNDRPTADDQTVSTAEDTALGITLTGSDVDGDPIGFTIGTGPAHGVLTGTPPNVTYTPAANYNGPDSFTFTTSDGALTSLPATVSITVTPVNDTPLATDDGATTDEDASISIAVLTNDALGDEPTTITSVTQGASGSVAIDPGATTVTYTPDLNVHGADSFTYTITDADLETSTATVSMTINPVNDTPVATDDGAATDEDVSISISVLTNDALGDEPTTITAVTQGTKGSVAIDPGATSVTYTPNLDNNGADSFTYTITDADLETSIATVSMTVNPVNDAPMADAGPDQT